MVAVAACSTPDDDDIGKLAAGIRSMPPSDQQIVTFNKENDRLWNIINGKKANNDKVGTVTCKERELPEFKNLARRDPWVTKEWMLQELRHNPTWGLAELYAAILRDFKPGPFGGNQCTPTFEAWPGFRIEELRAELDAAEQAEDDATDSAFWLPTLSSDDLMQRPVLLGVLGLIVVGGVIMVAPVTPIGLLLCPLSEAVQCPGSPAYAPGETPQPGDDGGDR